MWINLDNLPSIDTPAVHTWVLTGPNVPFNGLQPAQPNMAVAAQRNFAPVTTDTNGNPITIFSTLRKYFKVYQNKQYIGRISVYVTAEQKLRVTVVSVLLISNAGVTPQQRTQLITLFNSYDYAKDGDPVVYAASHLPAGVTTNMFSVQPSYILDRNGPPTTHDDQLTALKAMFDGKAGGRIDASGQTLAQYMTSRSIELVEDPPDDVVGDMPAPTSDPHEQDVPNPNNPPPDLFGNLAGQDAQGTGCVIAATEHVRIMTLLAWPEFKIEFHDVTIDIGCGVHIVVTLPQLYTRMGSLVLWAYVGHVANLSNMVIQQLVVCIENAAISGVVIGIVTENIAAAIAAFEGVFYAQLALYVNADIECLTPGLALLHEATPWH